MLDTFILSAQSSGITATQPVLLAVSGGLDSVVMAHLFKEAGFSFGIAHCNFGLRGAASDGDASFVKAIAAKYKVPFFVQHFDTESFAAQNGLSIQMAARQLRYDWFETVRVAQNYHAVATAHHLNDSVETLLLNLIRGTGLAGLTGIAARNGTIVRPLLFTTRADLAEYAEAHQIEWREDQSNASDDYARNYIRHHVMPHIETLNPNFLHTTERSMQRLGETVANYQYLIQTATHTPIQKSFLQQLPAPAGVLRDVLRPYGFTPDQAQQVAEHLHRSGLVLHSADGWQLVVDRDVITIQSTDQAANSDQTAIQIEADDLFVRLPGGGRLFLTPQELPVEAYPDGQEAIVVDLEQLRFPLSLRGWQPGDIFQPFGMHGQHQKLQDFFVNQKTTLSDKAAVQVLVNADDAIIWVVGMRMDERFRVGKNTRNALKINILQ